MKTYQTVAPPDTHWLTRHEAAAYARVSAVTIAREVRAGRLHCVRVGGRRSMRFSRTWVDAWLERASTDVLIRRIAWTLGVGPEMDEEATL